MNSTNWELNPTSVSEARAVENYHKRQSELYMGWWLRAQRRAAALQDEIDKLVVELDLREGPEFCAGCTAELENLNG